MKLPEVITEVFSISAAILASFGGAGVILFALSSWLGKLWAARILTREATEQNKLLEATKADLVRSIEEEKAKLSTVLEQYKSSLQELSASRLDALTRRREIYSKLATKMRILLKSGVPSAQIELEKQAFLAAYDEGYLWASENVVSSISHLIQCLEQKRIADINQLATNKSGSVCSVGTEPDLQGRAQNLYQHCLLQMRKDCGFPDSETAFRLVTFD